MNRTLGLSVLALVLAQAATGCQYSDNRAAYKSTYSVPKTYTAIYSLSKESIWTYPIPVQHVLVVDFDSGSGMGEIFSADQTPPDKLIWKLYPLDQTESPLRAKHYVGSPIDSGEIALSGADVTSILTVRDPVDPATLPQDRPIEEIEQDLPEPDALPEPDTADAEPAE